MPVAGSPRKQVLKDEVEELRKALVSCSVESQEIHVATNKALQQNEMSHRDKFEICNDMHPNGDIQQRTSFERK